MEVENQEVYVPPAPTGQMRNSDTRPTYKLSVKLLDTYKYINKVYYEAKAKKQREAAKTSGRGGVLNDGYDDQNYDYIIQTDEMIYDRYIIRYRMGKGSFGQVVCAFDTVKKVDVAIKIIKSRKPFFIQAKTEMEILSKILESDPNDERHFVRMIHDFVFRNHQCFVFELLSYNLYELLRNTKFRGVSLNLIRKFTIQLLRALDLLAKPDVNIIHCDIKPENILLRHPRRSAIKLIDFGSSCYANKRTYTYIQSRFYRSPEVMLGLPYTQKIDMWSLGCVLVEMHTGEPLFGGSNQVDQMCRIIDVLGMPPLEMIQSAPQKTRSLFFEKLPKNSLPSNTTSTSSTGSSSSAASSTIDTVLDFECVVPDDDGNSVFVLKRPSNTSAKYSKLSLASIIGVYSGGPHGRRAQEPTHTVARYEEFLDFITKLLVFDPNKRAAPVDLFCHPYLVLDDDQTDANANNANNANNTTTSSTSNAASTTTNTSTDQKDSSASSSGSGTNNSRSQPET